MMQGKQIDCVAIKATPNCARLDTTEELITKQDKIFRLLPPRAIEKLAGFQTNAFQMDAFTLALAKNVT